MASSFASIASALIQDSRVLSSNEALEESPPDKTCDGVRINEGLPTGERKKSPQLMGEISARWNAMSYDEQVSVTEPLLAELSELREMKKVSTRNVGLDAFHDAHANLCSLEHEIHALHARTNTEIILIAVRGAADGYLRPFTITTSERGSDFVRMVTKGELATLAIRFEAYCVAGVEGVVNNYVQDLLDLKKKTAALILQKLRDTSKTKISRMNYQNFAATITAKHGIVLENWPLDTFCNPSDIKTRNEVMVLLRSWESGSTRFRLMSTDEWRRWDERADAAEDPETHSDPSGNIDTPCGDDSPDSTNVDPMPSQPTSDHSSSNDNNFHEASVAGTAPEVDTATNTEEDAGETTSQKRTATDPPANSGAKKRKGLSNMPNFVNTVTGPDGVGLVLGKKPRKQRSDKGVKRGSRKAGTDA